MTGNEIIAKALRIINVYGIGFDPTAEQEADAQDTLNSVLESFSLEQLMFYHFTNESHSAVVSTGEYTIGSGGNWDTTRPARIEGAYSRDSDNYDRPIGIIDNDRYQQITDKTAESVYPKWLAYNPLYPLGVVNLFPVPSQNITIVLTTQNRFAAITNFATEIQLPPGYTECLYLNLAKKLCDEYGKPIPAYVAAESVALKQKIKTLNDNQRHEMRIDDALTINHNASFDIDRGY